MFSLLKTFLENIQSLKDLETEEEKFNGYGFMRRIYGVEEMPTFQTIISLTRTDSLTRTFNRLAFDDLIEREIDMTRRYASSLSLILLNIDFFSLINQRFNHLVSDALLREFARFLTDNIRKSDILFRWSGDEFLIIMAHTDAQMAEQFAQTITSRIEEHEFRSVGHITSTIACTEIGLNEGLDTVINRLQQAYNQAKQQRDDS